MSEVPPRVRTTRHQTASLKSSGLRSCIVCKPGEAIQVRMCCMNRVSASLLRRKKQQRHNEVKRARRMWHRSRNARVECTVGEHATVHSTALFTILNDLQP